MFDKDEQEISQIIEIGLEVILSGRMTLEQFLAEHPDQAAEIRPALETAVWLVAQQDSLHSRPGFMPASRKRVLERIHQEAGRQDAQHAFFGFLLPRRMGMRWAGVFTAAVMLFSSTGGLVSAAQGSLPGEFLYPVKRASEQVVEGMTLDELQRVELNSRFTGRRLDEAAALMTGRKYEAAEPALDAFEAQASRTVALLQEVSAGQAETKEALAVAVEEDLLRQAGRLQAMQGVSPAAMSGRLAQAQAASVQNAYIAGRMADEIHQGTATPSATPAESLTPEASPTPAAQKTQAPARGKTSQPGARDPQDDTISASPTPPGHVINTPKPTNVHRPTQKAKPGNGGNSSGNSGPGNNNGKPGKGQ